MRIGDGAPQGHMFFFSQFAATTPFEVIPVENFLTWVCVPLRDATIIVDYANFKVAPANDAKYGSLIATDTEILVLKGTRSRAFVNLSDGKKADIPSGDSLCFVDWRISTPRKKKSEKRRTILFSTKQDADIAAS
jgi:hypothetical protein